MYSKTSPTLALVLRNKTNPPQPTYLLEPFSMMRKKLLRGYAKTN